MLNPTADIEYYEGGHKQLAPGGDESKRAFTYMVLTTGRFVYASAVRLAVIKFLMSLSANKATLASASVEVDVGNIQVRSFDRQECRLLGVYPRELTFSN